jgi:excisionase family DNA binding protein
MLKLMGWARRENGMLVAHGPPSRTVPPFTRQVLRGRSRSVGKFGPMELERYWTPSEVAAALGMDPSTVRRKIAAGEIPAVDLGERRASYRVADSDLQAYLEGRRTTHQTS